MEYKAYELGIKQVGEGKVMATLAKLGVRDRDGDVLRKGLVGGHQIVAIKPQHKWDHVNLGVADVYENGDTMEAAMEFNMNIQSAKDWWEAIRFSHEKRHRTQYSFGFEPTDQEHGQHSDGKSARFLNYITLAECSPVLIGASMGSQTLSVKELADESTKEPPRMDAELPVIEMPKGRWAVGVHQTEIDLKGWDTSIQIHRIHKTGAPGYFRQIFAMQNPHADLTLKQSFAFPHHAIGPDGEPGAANVRACAEGIHALERWWAGMLPEDDLKGIYAHLASHLRDAQREPPELRAMGDARYPLDDQIELALWKLEDVLHQIDHVRDMRSRKGMTLTEGRMSQIEKMQQYFQRIATLVKLKQLDRPVDEVLEEMSAEARAETFGRRLESIREKVAKETKDREVAAIAERVQRWEARIRA